MGKMKVWNGAQWVEMDAKNSDTIGGKSLSQLVQNAGGVPSILSGTSLPLANTNGRLFIDETNKKLYRDNGTSWDLIGSSDTIDWSSVTGKPTTFPPSAHTHTISDVTGLQTALDGKLGSTSKAADSNLLDGLDSSQFLRSDTSDTINGSLKVNSIGNDLNGTYVAFPQGGSYKTSTGTVTGAIKITLPVGWNADMMMFSVDVYEYTTNESFTARICGYNYSSGSWMNPTAFILSNNSNRNFTVRWGFDGTNVCVYIGELASSWSYPQVVVRDFYAGYNNDSFDAYATGWNVNFEATAFQNVSQTMSNCLVTAGNIAPTAKIQGSRFVLPVGTNLYA